MKHIGLIINIVLMSALTVLNYFLVPTVNSGLSFLFGGWFTMLFVGVAVLGGLGIFIGSLFIKHKIKFLYIILGIGITSINTYWLIQILNVIR